MKIIWLFIRFVIEFTVSMIILPIAILWFAVMSGVDWIRQKYGNPNYPSRY